MLRIILGFFSIGDNNLLNYRVSLNKNKEITMAYSVFNNDSNPKQHYNVRILKLQPDKVLINGRIRDRKELSAEEYRAVKTQEDIDKQKKC